MGFDAGTVVDRGGWLAPLNQPDTDGLIVVGLRNDARWVGELLKIEG